MAFDSVSGRVLLFGGFDGARGLGDTWEWDGSTWIQRLPAASPSPRYASLVAFDSGRNRMVLFGGHSGSIYLSETWEWDGVDWTLMQPAVKPVARSGHVMCFDPLRGVTILAPEIEFVTGAERGLVIDDLATAIGQAARARAGGTRIGLLPRKAQARQ